MPAKRSMNVNAGFLGGGNGNGPLMASSIFDVLADLVDRAGGRIFNMFITTRFNSSSDEVAPSFLRRSMIFLRKLAPSIDLFISQAFTLRFARFVVGTDSGDSRTISIMSPTLQSSASQIRDIKSPDTNSPCASFENVDDEAPMARRRSVFVMSLSIRSFQSFLYDTVTILLSH